MVADELPVPQNLKGQPGHGNGSPRATERSSPSNDVTVTLRTPDLKPKGNRCLNVRDFPSQLAAKPKEPEALEATWLTPGT